MSRNNILLPNVFVSIRLHELFPDRLRAVAIHDHKLNKWSSCVMEVIHGDVLGETIYSVDEYIFDSENEAICTITDIVDRALENVKIMSN